MHTTLFSKAAIRLTTSLCFLLACTGCRAGTGRAPQDASERFAREIEVLLCAKIGNEASQQEVVNVSRKLSSDLLRDGFSYPGVGWLDAAWTAELRGHIVRAGRLEARRKRAAAKDQKQFDVIISEIQAGVVDESMGTLLQYYDGENVRAALTDVFRRSQSPEAQVSLLKILKTLGDPALKGIVLDSLKSNDGRIRSQAIDACLYLPGAEIESVLLPLLTDDTYVPQRNALIKAINAAPTPKAAPALLEFFSSGSLVQDSYVISLMGALHRCGHRFTLKELQRVIDSPDATVPLKDFAIFFVAEDKPEGAVPALVETLGREPRLDPGILKALETLTGKKQTAKAWKEANGANPGEKRR